MLWMMLGVKRGLTKRVMFISPFQRSSISLFVVFHTIEEAKILIEHWRRDYNRVRPHSALGYKPPAPEAILMPTMTATLCTGLPQGLT
jgi:transposase InsO family protein